MHRTSAFDHDVRTEVQTIMSTKQSQRASNDAFSAAAERTRCRRRAWLEKQAQLEPYIPGILESERKILAKLVDDDRLDVFRALVATGAKSIDAIIDAVLQAYMDSLSPKGVSQGQNSLKELLNRLRDSAQLLRAAFSTDIFESPDSGFGRMTRDDRLQFLDRLEQALVTIEVCDNVTDKHIAKTPTTRKQRGVDGSRTLFKLIMGQEFEREFGSPHDQHVADLAAVIFNAGEDELDSVRSARRRWNKRRPPEPELLISLSDELKPYASAISLALTSKRTE